MLVYGWSVLGLRLGLFLLCFYPIRSFVLRIEGDSVNGYCGG